MINYFLNLNKFKLIENILKYKLVNNKMAESANFSAGVGNARPTSQNTAIVSPAAAAGENQTTEGAGGATTPSTLKGHLMASATQKVLIHKLDDSVPTALINDPH